MARNNKDLMKLLRKRGIEGDVDFPREARLALVEGILDAEVSAQIGAQHGERNPERVTHHNGYRNRDWGTRAGAMELHIPKIRAGSHFPRLPEIRRGNGKPGAWRRTLSLRLRHPDVIRAYNGTPQERRPWRSVARAVVLPINRTAIPNRPGRFRTRRTTAPVCTR